MKVQYLVAARDQFQIAQKALVMAVRALQLSELTCDETQKAIKETIGDLAVVAETLNDGIESN